MELILSSATAKILERTDCVEIANGKCLQNQSYAFQVFLQSEKELKRELVVKSHLPIRVYREVKMKSDVTICEKQDDYYLSSTDDMYPDLLLRDTRVALNANESCVFFFGNPRKRKASGRLFD